MGFRTLNSYESIAESLTNVFPESPQFLTREVEINM